MPLLRWKPFHELDDLFTSNGKQSFDLAVDMHDDENTITLTMNIPGIDPDNIDIDVQNQHVHISGSRDEETETEDRHYYKKEIRRGTFERVVELPTAVIEDKTAASYKDGVLEITFYKRKTNGTQGKKISVKRG